jgi:hypothetical protein
MWLGSGALYAKVLVPIVSFWMDFVPRLSIYILYSHLLAKKTSWDPPKSCLFVDSHCISCFGFKSHSQNVVPKFSSFFQTQICKSRVRDTRPGHPADFVPVAPLASTPLAAPHALGHLSAGVAQRPRPAIHGGKDGRSTRWCPRLLSVNYGNLLLFNINRILNTWLTRQLKSGFLVQPWAKRQSGHLRSHLSE